MLPQLSPSQEKVYQRLKANVGRHSLCGFAVNYGHGRTFMLKRFAEEKNGHLLRLADFFEDIRSLHPLAIEEGIAATLHQALNAHDLVIVDDFHHISNLVESCYGKARPSILDVVFDTMLQRLEQTGKRLVLGVQQNHYPNPLNEFIQSVAMVEFTAEDHAFLFDALSGGRLQEVDFERVFVFAPHLNAIQMAYSCRLLPEKEQFTTDFLIRFLEIHALHSNVDMQEVELMDFADLYGVAGPDRLVVDQQGQFILGALGQLDDRPGHEVDHLGGAHLALAQKHDDGNLKAQN